MGQSAIVRENYILAKGEANYAVRFLTGTVGKP